MFTKRHTAYKLRIKDILSNDFVSRDGESDYVLVNDQQVSRVRVMATIVNRFINDERKSGSLIIDDGSEVISLRGWEDQFHMIDKTAIGQLIDVVARVREYNDQVYLVPEIIKKASPNCFVLRKLEYDNHKGPVKTAKPETNKPEEEDDGLKDSVFKKIKDGGSKGVKMDELIKVCGDKNTCKTVLKTLLEEDMIFEPRAGRYKKLE
ncbi:hypothetical protein GF352_00570 [archaeon]|nr:hypothetical protein [archaeon]